LNQDPTPPEGIDLDALAALLAASGRYRVLRRLVAQAAEAGDVVRQGLMVDMETTGLDPAQYEIIELAMRPFTIPRGAVSAHKRVRSALCGVDATSKARLTGAADPLGAA
jgi:hypothetical protein